MSLRTGVTKGTPKKLQFGAGVYFAGVSYDPKVAPTEEDIKAKLIGATQDGGTVTIEPEYFVPDLDGVTVAVKTLEFKVAETAKLETTMAEITADAIAKSVIGAVAVTTDKKYDVITSSDLEEGHYYDGFGFYGTYVDGRKIIVIFESALCTSGLSLEPKNKQNAAFKGTFECRADIEADDLTKLPYAIFIEKDGTMEQTTADQLKAVSK